jgi:hypothetical protein
MICGSRLVARTGIGTAADCWLRGGAWLDLSFLWVAVAGVVAAERAAEEAEEIRLHKSLR